MAAIFERGGSLALTWINHSNGHRVDAAAPLSHSFLLEPGTNVAKEVLATEAALVERGLALRSSSASRAS